MSFGFRLSAGLNLALLVVAILLFVRGQPAAEPVRASAVPAMAGAIKANVGAATPSHRGPDHINRAAVARFIEAGVPRTILADVVRHDFRRRWNKRIAELENRYAPKQPPKREYIALQRRHDEEQIRELKDLLGDDGYLAWDKEETLRKLNFEEVPMNPAESEQAFRLEKQLDGKLHELQMAMEDGDADIADMGTLQMQADQACEQGLQQLLGQKRYDQLKGYTVATVDGYMMFNELNLSGDQTNALKRAASEYQVQEAALAAQLKDNPTDAASIALQLQALNDAREEAFRKTLGTDAYESLRREHDDTYQTLTQYAGAWNLQDSEIEPVYEKIKAYENGVDLLRHAAQMRELAGQPADWKAVNAAIEQTRHQTETALQNLLGPDRAGRVNRNGLLSPLGSDRNAPHAYAGG